MAIIPSGTGDESLMYLGFTLHCRKEAANDTLKPKEHLSTSSVNKPLGRVVGVMLLRKNDYDFDSAKGLLYAILVVILLAILKGALIVTGVLS